ncbi:permease [Paenibacillus kobensis]|uniref:permease n=1 Tax=Paenibacillus kobensis TaxID=59841 RepID=UPI000FD72BD4|nr:permease [Paenibacillus kobensis]
MRLWLLRWSPPVLTAGCAAMLALIYINRQTALPSIGQAELNAFTMLFLGVIFEALPFMLLGVIVSAVLQVFVSENLIRKLAPRNPILGAAFGGLLGLLFPLCECGMIPVVRRLIRKGMPAYIGITYILAGPIVNPVVFASTYTAFRGQLHLVYERMILGFAVAFAVGLILHRYMRANPLKETVHTAEAHTHHHAGHEHHHHDHHHGGHAHHHDHHHGKQTFGSRLVSTLGHASDEFFDMGKYLIFGSLLTAMIQTGVDRSSLSAIADSSWLAHLFMMGFAYLLSLCSTSDAFIAASFSNMFSVGPLLAFLVFGPMIDLKNTLMLLSVFKLRIVLAIIALTAVLVYVSTWVAGALHG